MANSEISKIISDNTSGSTEIFLKLSDLITKNINNEKKLIQIVLKSKKELSDFEIIRSFLLKIEKSIGNKRNLKNIISLAKKDLNSSFIKIFQNLRPYVKNKKNILTISNSKTLFEIFKLWQKEQKKLKIIISESQPKEEGKIFAKSLLKENINTELITDAMISLYVPKIDAVIIGADKILKNKNVVNKIGSKSAAILCKYFKKPFYVIASIEKFSNENNFKPKTENRKEVWDYDHKKLKVNNIYFEEIENKLITKIITD